MATKKVTTKKTTTKAVAPKKTTKPAVKTKSKVNPALMKPYTPSKELSVIVGAKPIPRSQMTKKVWDYIKANNLQDAKNKRNINADEALKPIFGKKTVTMFEMTKLLSKHLS
jgi:chromatin remodeling complex protein RSC6